MLFILLALAAAAQSGEAESGRWAWLNIPDVEGRAARFSYDAQIHRDGSRLQVRLRHAPDASDAPAEALVELDCIARTARTLEQATNGRVARHPESAPAPIMPGTREAVLAYLLCPGGGRP